MSNENKKDKTKYVKTAIGSAIALLVVIAAIKVISTSKEDAAVVAADAGMLIGKKLAGMAKDKYSGELDKLEEYKGKASAMADGIASKRNAKTQEEYLYGSEDKFDAKLATEEGNEYGKFSPKLNTSEKMINLGDLPMPIKDAHKLFNSYIISGNTERIKFMYDSGYRPEFDNNGICISDLHFDIVKITDETFSGGDVDTFVSRLGSNWGSYFTPTACDRNYLEVFSRSLDKRNGGDFFYYNMSWDNLTNDAVKKRDKEKMNKEALSEKAYFEYVNKLPIRDYAGLMFIVEDRHRVFSQKVREDALDKFLNHYEEFAGVYEGNSGEFIKAALANIERNLKIKPNDYNLLIAKDKIRNPLNYLFNRQVKNYLGAASEAMQKQEMLNRNIESEKSINPAVENLKTFNLSVYEFIDGRHIFEETKEAAAVYFGAYKTSHVIHKSDFQKEHELDIEVRLLSKIINHKNFEINKQDLLGNTVLHNLAEIGNDGSPKQKASAILSRVLLNAGLNANLLNKDNKTALSIALDKNQNLPDSHIIKAYTDKDYTGLE